MSQYSIPLIIRGRVITDGWVDYNARHGKLSFRSPSVAQHMNELVLKNPRDLRDLYSVPMPQILDYLEKLGPRLDIRTNVYLQQALEMVLESSHQTKEMATPVFEAMPAMFTRTAVMELIERNVGLAYLEGWVDEKMSDREVAVRAFGARGVHVIAGNVPVLAAYTVIMNAVTRSDAIIKLPSNDPYTAAAIVQTMVEMAPDHPITRHVSVGYWKGGDEGVEKPLYDSANIEKIVAWGGFSSMRSIRKYLAPGIDLVALDPKVSGTIIGKEAFASETTMREAADRVAFDIGHYNQSGCASAKVICIETGTDAAGIELANKFGKMVFDAVQALPPSVSSRHPAFDPTLKEEIDGLRYSEDFRIIGGRQSEGAVIVSQADEEVPFSEMLDCRVANLVPVATIDDALRHVTIHTQTLGVYPDSLKARIRDDFALRGGQRIVSLGFATAATQVGPWDAMEPMRRQVRWLRDDTMSKRTGYLFG